MFLVSQTCMPTTFPLEIVGTFSWLLIVLKIYLILMGCMVILFPDNPLFFKHISLIFLHSLTSNDV